MTSVPHDPRMKGRVKFTLLVREETYAEIRRAAGSKQQPLWKWIEDAMLQRLAAEAAAVEAKTP